jgi:hypothetical protein
MNMSSYDVEKYSNSVTSKEYSAKSATENLALLEFHQTEENFVIKNRALPLSLTTVDVEIFLRKMAAE